MATRNPNPSASGVISELGVTLDQILPLMITQAQVQQLIATNTALAGLEPAVRALIASSDLAIFGGFAKATSVKMLNGALVEDVLNQLLLGNASPSAPQITSTPVLSDTTPTAGQIITITPATVTDQPGRTHDNTYKVVFPGAPGFQPVYQTGLTYQVPASVFGYPMLVVQRSADHASPTIFVEKDSLLTDAVGGVPPSIDVAPTMSPSGPQPAGTTINLGLGTATPHTGASISLREYRVSVGGIPVGPLPQTATTFVTDQSMAGKAVTATIVATDNLGLKSSETPFANSITLTGTAYQASSAPTLPATVTEGQQATLGAAVWPTTYLGNPFSVTVQKREIFYNGDSIIGATLTPPGVIYTPELQQDTPSVLINAGITRTAGATIYVKESVVGSDGLTYSAVSTTRVIQAASATLQISLTTAGAAGYGWFVGFDIAPATPAAATGGSGSGYVFTWTGLPTGVTLGANGTFPANGNPSTALAQVATQVTVRDSAGNTAGPVTVLVQVATSVVTPLASAFRFPSPLPNVTGTYEIEAPADADGADYSAKSFNNGLSIPPLSVLSTVTRGGVVTFGPTTTTGGVPCTRHEIRQGFPLRHNGARSELTFANVGMLNDTIYWLSGGHRPDSNMTQGNFGGSGDRFSIWQIHQDSSISPGQNPLFVGVFGDAAVGQEIQWFTAQNSTQATRVVYRSSINAGQWWRWIARVRMSQTSALFDVWIAYGAGAYQKLIPVSAGLDTAAWGEAATSENKPCYMKVGFYKFTTGVWGSAPNRGMLACPPFIGQGVNLYDNAAAANSAFAIAA